MPDLFGRGPLSKTNAFKNNNVKVIYLEIADPECT